jgi:hypothetical protein
MEILQLVKDYFVITWKITFCNYMKYYVLSFHDKLRVNMWKS